MFRVNGWNWTMRRTRSARRHVIATNRITPTGYDEASAFSGPEFIEVNKLTTIISLLELIFKKIFDDKEKTLSSCFFVQIRMSRVIVY
jgi:hypothetical protein